MGIRVFYSMVLLYCTAFGKMINEDNPENWSVGDTILFESNEYYDEYYSGWEAVQLNNPYIICVFVGKTSQYYPFEGRIAIDAEGTFKKYKGHPPIEFGDPVPDGKYVYKRIKTFILQNGFKEEIAILEFID